MRNLFTSAVHFMLVLGISCASLFFLGVSLSVPLRSSFFSFFNQPDVFFHLGLAGLFFSFVLFLCFYSVHRKSFYQLKMQEGKTSIDQSLVEEVIHRFFSEKMPEIPNRIEVFFRRKKKMEVIIAVPDAFQESFYQGIQKWEKELDQELFNKIGYRGEWLLTVSTL